MNLQLCETLYTFGHVNPSGLDRDVFVLIKINATVSDTEQFPNEEELQGGIH